MSQLPANLTLGTSKGVDESLAQDRDVGSDALPSAAHSSGLTPAVRRHLDERFQSSGAETLVSELRAQVAEIDSRSVAEDDPDHARLQAERALLVAQISYVEDDLAVHGVTSDRMDRTERVDWQEDGVTRAVGEPIAGATARGSRRVRVYDSTADR